MIKNHLLKRSFIFIFLFSYTLSVAALSISEQREVFFRAEKLLKQGHESSFLIEMEQLRDYALYPVLQYQYLSKHPEQEREIQSFLTRYKHSRYANSLRRQWLISIARQGRWSHFMNAYQPTKNISLQCYYHLAQYETGNRDVAMEAAKKIWLKPYSLPDNCNPLFSVFKRSSFYNQALLWQRFEIAMRKGKKKNIALASALIKNMDSSGRQSAQLWLKVRRKPILVTQPHNWNTRDPKAGKIFAQGLYLIARKKTDLAISTWNAYQRDFQIDAVTRDYVEKRLGLVSAYQGNVSTAYHHLSKVSNPDLEAKEWRVRAALRQQNWQYVKDSLTMFSAEEKNQEKWRYWLARASEKLNDHSRANQLYRDLAKERSYYGFASADKINAPYQLNDRPIIMSESDLRRFEQQPEFSIVKELYALSRDKQAKKDWWFIIKHSDNEKIKHAAKLAQRWGMIQTAIFTVAKAKYWDDVALRYPLLFRHQIIAESQVQNLNPAMVFGLVRQESVFNERAGSRVGAKGLMQIMPATGKQIARELGVRWRSSNSLYNPDTNLQFGTYYYKKQINRFDGQLALAAAGYNAGPHRVKKWRPYRPMAMDIWIETIPFDETRKYVSVVLRNTLIYQQRLQGRGLKMQHFLSVVQPRKNLS
ncbi:MAG: transglycosylase SLT domain-containing protein [Methylococcales bacterium]|nr:transglycosylase SLT domain-containing protein [Methylococcales bacterium]